jgi:hypothetical protein
MLCLLATDFGFAEVAGPFFASGAFPLSDLDFSDLDLAGGAILATVGLAAGTLASLGCGLLAGEAFVFAFERLFFAGIGFFSLFTLSFLDFVLLGNFGAGDFLPFLADAETLPPLPAEADRAAGLVFFFFEGGTRVSPGRFSFFASSPRWCRQTPLSPVCLPTMKFSRVSRLLPTGWQVLCAKK